MTQERKALRRLVRGALIAAICSSDSENEKMSRFSRWRSGLPDLGRGRAPSW